MLYKRKKVTCWYDGDELFVELERCVDVKKARLEEGAGIFGVFLGTLNFIYFRAKNPMVSEQLQNCEFTIGFFRVYNMVKVGVLKTNQIYIHK